MKPDAFEGLQRLAGNRDLLCDFINSFPLPIQVYAPDGMLIAANPAFLSEFRIPHRNLIVGRYNILSDPTLEEYGVLPELHAAFRGQPGRVMGIPAQVHRLKQWFRIPVHEAELYYLDIYGFPLKDEQDKMICLVIVYVTQRKILDRDEIVRAKEYMEAHWQEKFSLEAVAKAALMSTAHFARLFKACTGTTPHGYYVKIKIEKLKEALLDVNQSIEQAFAVCGLQYHGHYARLFKKETGLSPSEYRRLAQSQVADRAIQQ